jgi:hypothetical protein
MTDTKSPPEWTLERYTPGADEAVRALYATVFGKPSDPAHWNWQFRDNPYGGPFIALGRSGRDGSVIGSYSVMPVPLNVMGRPVPGCQSVDTAVHPDWRNQRVFETTARECYAWCAESGIRAVHGFPNARSYPGFMRSLDWRRIAFPRQYLLRLDLSRALGRAGLGPLAAPAGLAYRWATGVERGARRRVIEKQAGPGIDVTVTPAVPDDYESLWAMVRSQEVLSVWKDADYLRWRYDRHPARTFAYHALRRNGELTALAVVVDLAGAWTLCEFMVRGREVAVGRLLLDRIARAATAAGAVSLEFIGHDLGFFDEAFEGFERRLSTANVFCGRSFEDGVLRELLPHGDNWTFTFGDGDFV